MPTNQENRMKNKNWLHISIICLAGLGILSGCRGRHNKEELTPQPTQILKLHTEGIKCNASGDTYRIGVTASDDWTIQDSPSWISVSKVNRGEASITIDINYEEARDGKVVFISGELNAELHIEQEAAPTIELAKKLIETDGDGGIFNVLYMSDTETEAITDNEWIRIIPNSTYNNIAFEIKRNHGAERQGTIIVRSASDSRFKRVLSVCQGPKIPHPKLTITEGNSMTITSKEVTILHPEFEDMENHSLTWKSSAPEIAEVNQAGEITVHKSGSCKITVRNDYHDIEASISIEVKLKVTGFHIMFGNQDVTQTPTSVRFVGEELKVSVEIEPEHAYSEDIILFSTNTEVAAFKGHTLHCLSPGKTEIYVESAFSEIRQSFTVIVIKYEE